MGRAWLTMVFCALGMCAAGCAGHKSGSTLIHNARLSDVVFSAVDVETTGLDSKTDRIVEIGVVRFRHGRKISSRSWLVNPGIPIPSSAESIHGITTEMVRTSPAFAEVFSEFRDHVGSSVMIAHNAKYDLAFLNSEIARAGLSSPKIRVVDTLPVFRQWFPKASRHTLEFMIQYLELKSEGFHRGMSDAESLFAVFKEGVDAQSSELTLEDLIRMAGGELRFAAQGRKDSDKTRD